MYPFLTENKAFARGEEGGELPSEFFSVPPSTSHGFRANIHKSSFAFNLRTWTQSHSQLFPPCSCLPTSRNCISAVYGLDPVEKKKKDLPTPELLFAIDLDSFGTGAFASLKDQDSKLVGHFPETRAGNYPQTQHLSRITSGESGPALIFIASAPLSPSSKQSRLGLAILAQMNIKIDAEDFFVPWMSTVSVSHCGFRKEGTSQTRSFWGSDGNW